ncbi:hypothetical protein RCG24_10005 [Neobacillus sp. OS1-32]|uniref:hypothetical protein n=1 Tax=Neobacillus sp. OS1-32 TaxID=3070682 RepID=UPI0027E0139E|nr:hypothetical protein [Neobacillus sp. OS1-32]WML32137.1 hypothetical protein RCG24_10005 [Neobacillus sp. OS1-32]
MKIVTVIFYIVSAIFLLGSVNYFIALKRPGVYPPKQLLKSRAAVLAGGGGIFLIIALIFSYIS